MSKSRYTLCLIVILSTTISGCFGWGSNTSSGSLSIHNFDDEKHEVRVLVIDVNSDETMKKEVFSVSGDRNLQEPRFVPGGGTYEFRVWVDDKGPRNITQEFRSVDNGTQVIGGHVSVNINDAGGFAVGIAHDD